MTGLRRATRSLLRNDLRKLSRDPVLLATAFVPVLLTVLLRFALPSELAAHRPVILAGALAITAMLGGWIVGFMLLEERAEGMIPALSVTPLTRAGFVRWRLISPTVIALLGAVLVVFLGARDPVELARGFAACALMALSAPLFALALVGVADNEVEGLALAKLGGLVFILPLVTLYIDSPWAWLAAALPPFWPIRLLLGGAWWTAPAGLVVALGWGLLLLRRFAARVE
jgi:fluoroquinolone transport system permease protein